MTTDNPSTFKFSILVPRYVSLPDEGGIEIDRDTFYEWLWTRFMEQGLVGVHEGTLLSDEAFSQGLEKDAWTVDSAEAPRDRDWVGSQDEVRGDLFFSDASAAEKVALLLKGIPELQVGDVIEQKPQDWDAEWKASFLNSGSGVPVAPFWRVVPPWFNSAQDVTERLIKINPGAGFGTGTHETTQICLEAIGNLSQKTQLNGCRALDFGSGSGILSIALALLGAEVDAVELDPLAIDNARENIALNGVLDKVRLSQALAAETQGYQVIVANILKPVLLEFAEPLKKLLLPGGVLILSGLIEKDVQVVLEQYSNILGMQLSQVVEKGDWRGIVLI
jgi:ribosomal protein L11 methyltransferase